MTPSESLNMAYELIAWASVCLNYTAGKTKPLLVAELETAHRDLEAVKKESTALSLCIEEMTKAVEDERVNAADNLKKAQGEVSSFKRSVDTLKLDLKNATTQHDELIKERDAIITERDKLIAKNASLGDEICQNISSVLSKGLPSAITSSTPPWSTPIWIS